MEQKDVWILLVEDELPVRKLVAELLGAAGYEVVSASSGPDALRAFHRSNGTIRLLLTDVDLSEGISGVEVAERLLAIRPDLTVLFMSGSPNESIPFTPTIHFLGKPFTPAKLLEKVQEVLADQGATLFRKDCRWIKRLLSRRYPHVNIECKEEHGDHFLLRLRRRPEAAAKDVRFSIREYLEGNWEDKIEAAVDSLWEAG